MTTTIAPGSLVTDPEMEATHYGIPLTSLGEDGDMLALGHHAPRHTVAALNRHARTYYGMVNLADDREANAQDWLNGISQQWAVFRTPTEGSLAREQGWLWVAHPATADTPDARPITYLAPVWPSHW